MTEMNSKPIYDERVNEILSGLEQNLSRDELAEMFGHKSYKTLDIYMRRKHFTWDSTRLTYVPKLGASPLIKDRVMPTSKAGMVVEMMKLPNFNIDEICQKTGFQDHRQLAEYMSAKGYVWSPTDSRYIQKHGLIEEKPIEVKQEERVPVAATVEPVMEFVTPLSNDLLAKMETYLPLFQWLDTHKEKLKLLIEPATHSDTFPRYILPGRASGKTIQMAEVLQDMAVTFCNERNIKQRELFEMALIEFFKQNGYNYDIANLMQSYS